MALDLTGDLEASPRLAVCAGCCRCGCCGREDDEALPQDVYGRSSQSSASHHLSPLAARYLRTWSDSDVESHQE